MQGCTLHIHGPVQAWSAIADAGVEAAVLAIIQTKCSDKITAMSAEGVPLDDPRIRKEVLTFAFCYALLSHAGCLA